jgi:four helix bundle protein
VGKINTYKELTVWQKAMSLAKEIYFITQSFPEVEKFGLTQQLKRAAISVPSNIAEGWGRNSTGHFIQFLNISKGSICEIETQLIIAMELNYTTQEKINSALNLLIEISKMIKSLIDTLESSKVNNVK